MAERVKEITISTDQRIRNVIYSTTQNTITTDEINSPKPISPVSSVAVKKYVEDMLKSFADERIVALENAIKNLGE